MENGQLKTRDFYESIIKESPVGYGYHKLIRDDEGNPLDYEFLEINEAFEKLTGLEKSEVIGSRGTEIFPSARKGDIDWIEEYGKIAGTGESREFERFSEDLDRWFRIKVYSPNQDHFVTYFTDLTQEMKLASASEDILQQPRGEIDYQALTDKALDISGAKSVYFNLFEEDGKSFTTKAVSGPREDIQRAASLLGFDIVGKIWEPDPARREKMKDQSIIHFDSITELSRDRISKSIIKWLERAFSLGETVLARIQNGDQMLGDFTIVMPEGKSLEKERLIEIYTRQVGSLIIRNRAEKEQRESEKKLKESKERYQSYFEELGDAIFILQMGGENHGKILEVNSSAEKQTGYHRDELIGMNMLEDLTAGEPLEKNLQEMNDKLSNGETVNFTERKIRKDGTQYWTEVVVTPIQHEAEQANLSINRDITKRVQVQQALKEEREKLKKLHNAVDQFQACTSKEELYRTTLEVTSRVLGFDISIIFVARGEQLIPVAADGLETSQLPSFEKEEALVGKVHTEERTIWGDDIREIEVAKPESPELRSFMSVPIGDLGVFQASSKEEGTFTEVDIELTDIMAGHLNEEIKRIRLEGELKRQSIHDPLTKLYNRRYFNETLQEEVKKSKRYHRSIAFLMADVNRFKEINDSYSHQVGDRVLQEVAGLLEENVRDADTVVRYGGDEFLVMMPGTDGGVANTVDRVNEKLDRWNERSDLLDFPLTLAMGVSHWSPDQDRDVEEALKEADRKMYKDKRK